MLLDSLGQQLRPARAGSAVPEVIAVTFIVSTSRLEHRTARSNLAGRSGAAGNAGAAADAPIKSRRVGRVN
eukprot:3496701-Pyramimonas_sp.AAC.1